MWQVDLGRRGGKGNGWSDIQRISFLFKRMVVVRYVAADMVDVDLGKEGRPTSVHCIQRVLFRANGGVLYTQKVVGGRMGFASRLSSV